MELRVLNYFLRVAGEGSMTAAAAALHVTQPTLSRQLKELEDELGQRLFTRGSHRLSLTEEGMFLRRRAEEILDIVHRTHAAFHSHGAELAGEISIGCGETDAMRQVGEVMCEMQRDHPRVKFNIFSGNAVSVMERIDRGTLDFGLLIQPVDISKYNSIRLPVKDRWGLIMRKDSPLARRKTISPADLKGIPLLTSRQLMGQQLVHPCSEWFRGDFGKLNIVASYNLIYNAAIMVDLGMGYAIGLDKLVDATAQSHLCFRPFAPRLESSLDIAGRNTRSSPRRPSAFSNASAPSSPPRTGRRGMRHVVPRPRGLVLPFLQIRGRGSLPPGRRASAKDMMLKVVVNLINRHDDAVIGNG